MESHTTGCATFVKVIIAILSSESRLFNGLHGIFRKNFFPSLFPRRGQFLAKKFACGARKGGVCS
jgi:hypothetical protein